MKPIPATLANWRTAPHNRWAFHHVRELIPTADIAHDVRKVRELPRGNAALEIRVEPDSGEPLTLAQFLAETQTDGFVVLHRGRLIAEHYGNGMGPDDPHILMSVSKSMLGLLVGLLGIDVERKVVEVVPELGDTAYRGATLRHLLDMRAGIAFDEDYLATSGPIVEYRKASGWNPLGAGDTPSDLRSFYSHLQHQDGSHGGPFRYKSPNTDLLGWVIEAATGERYADLMSRHLWQPIGAERSAYITLDRLGAPRTAGGMCVTARDLARVGQWMIETRSAWIDDIENNGERKAWDEGDLRQYFPGLPIRYRSKWYVLEASRGEKAAPLIFGVGIHGQNLFVDRANQLVIAKLSSQAMPLDPARIGLTMRAVSEIRKVIS
jgi:CubicO group peptidase (beta-lactamase class C family)